MWCLIGMLRKLSGMTSKSLRKGPHTSKVTERLIVFEGIFGSIQRDQRLSSIAGELLKCFWEASLMKEAAWCFKLRLGCT